MEALGWSLIAGGLVLLVSGLFFLLRMRREQPAQQQDIEQTIREIDDQLHETRRERGDTS
jgi:LPXTG-motif cell wall-anchored protein